MATLQDVFPAGAGMNQIDHNPLQGFRSVPRRRGDEPPILTTTAAAIECSPQARGSTVERDEPAVPRTVFPAGAGMNRNRSRAE